MFSFLFIMHTKLYFLYFILMYVIPHPAQCCAPNNMHIEGYENIVNMCYKL